MLDRPAEEKHLPSEIYPEPTAVFVRSHTRVKNEKPRKDGEGKLPDKWANYALVFDCETTMDIRQDLNFLWWRFCERKQDAYVCQQEGLVYADALDPQSIELIHKHAKNQKADVEVGCPKDILVQSRTEFVDGEFWTAVQAGAVIVCFNAPFDLSRLALEYREARNKNTGWSMVLWRFEGKPDKLKPKLKVKPKDSRSAFISFGGGDPNNRTVYRGRFIDLSVLGWALRNRHMTLEGFLSSFGLEGKIDHEPTGCVTDRELAYGRRDTERTVALLNAMKREYDGFPIDLSPERAMSAASITKAFLDKMEVEQPSRKFDLPDHILGKCMQAYYGGRSEIRIRHEEMPIVVCDTTSEYPSVAGLLRLWPLLTAANVEVEECTEEARRILDSVDTETILDPSLWPRLAFFASVKPAGDILPVRALYGESGETNIGLNPLTSSEPIWYAGPDLAASRLAKEVTPQIIEAFRIVPHSVQEGMKATTIGNRTINPVKDDFFRVVIEERKNLNLGRTSFIYDESRFVVTAVDLPIVSWVAEATEDVPCLALSIRFDMSMVRELIGREEIHVAEAPPDSPAISIGETTPEFLNACCRLVDLLRNPRDVPFLSGLIQREIIYRVLRGRAGARLPGVATLGDQSHRTAKAIAWIAANYATPLRVEDLAQVASMGVSTLHHHFRMLTAMSPLQYQKQLRLQSARSLMLNNGLDAASAAFEVGYESATQFNREYSRFFGQPPMRDVRALLSPGAPKLEVVGNLG